MHLKGSIGRRSLVAIALAVTGLTTGLAVAARSAEGDSTMGINGKIAFGRFDPATEANALFTIDPDGSDELQMPITAAENPFWAPDGTRLSYPCQPSEHIQACIVNPDGTGLVTISPQPAGGADIPRDFYPTAWSPDGTRLVGGGSTGVPSGIFTMRASDGADVVRITTNSETEEDTLAYAPDGSSILFLRLGPNDQGTLFVVNSDGSGLVRLTPPGLNVDFGFPRPADYAPNGSRIVFAGISKLSSGRGTTSALYTVRPDGSRLRRITTLGAGAESPRWSPDGRWIAFNDKFVAYPQIYLVHPDGSELTQVTLQHQRDFSWNPVWSPGGTQLVIAHVDFERARGQEDLWIINADGTDLHRLTDTPDLEDAAAWGTASPTP
jgi:Tol biopolymer transport system component